MSVSVARKVRVRMAILGVALLVGVLGVPVGGQTDGTWGMGAPEASAEVVGSTPLDDVLYWAGQKARCGLNRDQLAAMMLAPTYPETGASGTWAPSPMTHGRYDNQSGLYAFGDSSTVYRNAFWHAGLGMFAFDSAGGWNFTAAGAISSWTSAAQAADTMAARWCANPSRTYVWGPWFGCNTGKCEEIYQRIYNGTSLVNVTRDAAVTRHGGMEQRTCSLQGAHSTTFDCWYVDPQKAEGYRGWLNPLFGPSPISAPYYVFDRGGREERHWLNEDTGYVIGVWADKPITANARTSLVWRSGEVLCDRTAGRGSCPSETPQPPQPLLARDVDVPGTHVPVIGDFDGNGYTDVLWYTPGPGADTLWKNEGTSFRSVALTVNGSYLPLVGDWDGNGADDILWYAVGTAPDVVWYSTPFGFAGQRVVINGVYWPVVGDFDADGREDIYWISPGPGVDYIGLGTDRWEFTSVRIELYAPGSAIPGDYDGDGRTDLLWYTADDSVDTMWFARGAGGFDIQTRSMSGVSWPVVGDFDGNGLDDLIWYAPGTAQDRLWWSESGRTHTEVLLVVNNTYDAVTVADLDGNGADDVVWFRRSTEADYVGFGSSARTFTSGAASASGDYVLLPGRFGKSSGEAVFWYSAGPVLDTIWSS